MFELMNIRNFKIQWSSPELLREQKYSFKSDIWSFGIVCIEILTRNIPYPQMKPIDVRIKKQIQMQIIKEETSKRLQLEFRKEL